jgi:hypothetical protein
MFGYISSSTPKYTLEYDTPWLFFKDQFNDEPSSFYYNHSQEEIDMVCDNIKDLADKLEKHYNLTMVFMAVPTKFTIYSEILTNDVYNNFLPRIYAGLEKRNIPVIKLYEDFNNSDEILYLGTDTHWNNKGIAIAVDNAVDVVQPMLKDNSLIATGSTPQNSNTHKNKL